MNYVRSRDAQKQLARTTLSANGDQQQFSPNNIHTLPKDKVMRINENDHQRENAMIFYQINSSNS